MEVTADVACTPDFSLLVVLSAPHNEFLADFSLREHPGGHMEKTCQNARANYIYICLYIHRNVNQNITYIYVFFSIGSDAKSFLA
jgi:hypothetical protein